MQTKISNPFPTSSGVVSDNRQISWNAFISSLAFAELAAANQCEVIARGLAQADEPQMAALYRNFATEEISHFHAARAACLNLVYPPVTAQRVYQGELMSRNAGLLERIAAIHLVFEPAAIAFLGFLYNEAPRLLGAGTWADTVIASFSQILRDEVGHISEGRKFVKERWAKASREERHLTKLAIRKHRAFLKAGLVSFFKSDPSSSDYVPPMLKRFDHHLDKALEGVFE